MTPEQLVKIVPTLALAKAQEFIPFLNAAMEEFQINTPARVGGFICHLAHESQGLTKFVENLNYSAARLRAVFSKYFPTDRDAFAYERRSEKLQIGFMRIAWKTAMKPAATAGATEARGGSS